jgi:hypothetical protein
MNMGKLPDLKDLLHYDMILGSHPDLEAWIDQALAGDRSMLDWMLHQTNMTHPIASRLLGASYHYRQEGQQVYCVKPQLQAMLHETKAESVPRDKLRLPYPCLYVAFPESSWHLWGGSRTRMHQMAGAYLVQLEEHVDKGLHILLWAKANERSLAKDDDASFSLGINFAEIPVTSGDSSCFDVESYLEIVLNDPTRATWDPGMGVRDAEPEEQAEQDRSVRAALRVLVNLVLYLNSTNAETEQEPQPNLTQLRAALKRARSSKKRKKIERQIKKATGTQVTYVGPSFDREPDPSNGADGIGTGTWVFRKGHFHHFWVGPRKDEEGRAQKGTHTVLKWVPPKRRDQASILASRVRRLHKVRMEPDT